MRRSGGDGAGSALKLVVTWSNAGVAPSYLPRAVTYRLRKSGKTATHTSGEDIRSWLPGSRSSSESFAVPANLAPGEYTLEVALLDRAGKSPTTPPLPPLHLGISGRRSDGYYPLSIVTVD